MLALWAAAMYLVKNKKNHWICTIPATFMSGVSMTYFACAPECLGLLWTPLGIGYAVYYPIALVIGAVCAVAFLAIFLKAAKK